MEAGKTISVLTKDRRFCPRPHPHSLPEVFCFCVGFFFHAAGRTIDRREDDFRLAPERATDGPGPSAGRILEYALYNVGVADGQKEGRKEGKRLCVTRGGENGPIQSGGRETEVL